MIEHTLDNISNIVKKTGFTIDQVLMMLLIQELKEIKEEIYELRNK